MNDDEDERRRRARYLEELRAEARRLEALEAPDLPDLPGGRNRAERRAAKRWGREAPVHIDPKGR